MNNQPASKMVRVPTPLIKFVTDLSRLYRQGKKESLYQGLQELIAAVDSSADINQKQPAINIDNNLIAELIQRIERLEERLEQHDSNLDSSADSTSTSAPGLTTAELAKKLGISQRQLYRLKKDNQLHGWKAITVKGKTLRYIPTSEA